MIWLADLGSGPERSCIVRSYHICFVSRALPYTSYLYPPPPPPSGVCPPHHLLRPFSPSFLPSFPPPPPPPTDKNRFPSYFSIERRGPYRPTDRPAADLIEQKKQQLKMKNQKDSRLEAADDVPSDLRDGRAGLGEGYDLRRGGEALERGPR